VALPDETEQKACAAATVLVSCQNEGSHFFFTSVILNDQN